MLNVTGHGVGPDVPASGRRSNPQKPLVVLTLLE